MKDLTELISKALTKLTPRQVIYWLAFFGGYMGNRMKLDEFEYETLFGHIEVIKKENP